MARSFLSATFNQRFRRKLLALYHLHARDLPWRASRDPYRVWLSEIMLQQTRVAAVIGHYNDFLRRFPTVKKLAAAREASVLAAWSGLGYYQRARRMHAAAKVIVREHGGSFPTSAEGLAALPGIGRYTAAAVASICFGVPVAVVDGNVERVLQRLRGERLEKEELWETARRLLDSKRPGDFNQAMMELGATVCTPRAPACLACPVMALCATRGELPATGKPAPQIKREVHYVLDCRNGNARMGETQVFLVQRAQKESLMPGMWELPEKRSSNIAETRLFTLRHSITITNYSVQVWRKTVPTRNFYVERAPSPADGGTWVPAARLRHIALTGLARKILRRADLLQ